MTPPDWAVFFLGRIGFGATSSGESAPDAVADERRCYASCPHQRHRPARAGRLSLRRLRKRGPGEDALCVNTGG